MGGARWNSHIGWYETQNGTYAWIPYDESKDSMLIRSCSGYVDGNGTPVLGDNQSLGINPDMEENSSQASPSRSNGNVRILCGPASPVLIPLAGVMRWKR